MLVLYIIAIYTSSVFTFLWRNEGFLFQCGDAAPYIEITHRYSQKIDNLYGSLYANYEPGFFLASSNFNRITQIGAPLSTFFLGIFLNIGIFLLLIKYTKKKYEIVLLGCLFSFSLLIVIGTWSFVLKQIDGIFIVLTFFYFFQKKIIQNRQSIVYLGILMAWIVMAHRSATILMLWVLCYYFLTNKGTIKKAILIIVWLCMLLCLPYLIYVSDFYIKSLSWYTAVWKLGLLGEKTEHLIQVYNEWGTSNFLNYTAGGTPMRDYFLYAFPIICIIIGQIRKNFWKKNNLNTLVLLWIVVLLWMLVKFPFANRMLLTCEYITLGVFFFSWWLQAQKNGARIIMSTLLIIYSFLLFAPWWVNKLIQLPSQTRESVQILLSLDRKNSLFLWDFCAVNIAFQLGLDNLVEEYWLTNAREPESSININLEAWLDNNMYKTRPPLLPENLRKYHVYLLFPSSNAWFSQLTMFNKQYFSNDFYEKIYTTSNRKEPIIGIYRIKNPAYFDGLNYFLQFINK